MFRGLKNVHMTKVFENGEMEQDVVGEWDRAKVYRAFINQIKNLDFILSLIENKI